MAQEHTPTPWKVSQHSNFSNGYIYTTVQPENPVPETMRHLLMASGEYDVCHMMHTPLHRKAELHLADAEFIVASVNAYASSRAEIARLRKALDLVIAAIGDWSRPTGANGMVSADDSHPLVAASFQARAIVAQDGA